jgi:hypothetical protein
MTALLRWARHQIGVFAADARAVHTVLPYNPSC